MEELQEALEDAQYVSAITINQGPAPLTAWETPSEAALTEWKEGKYREWKSLSTNDEKDDTSWSEPFTFKSTISHVIGFFCLSSYLKDEKDYIHVNFIEEVARFKRLQGKRKGAKLRLIYKKYLLKCETDPETNSLILPKMTEIDENDLHVVPFKMENTETSDLDKLMASNFNPDSQACCIGLDGSIRDEIIATIEHTMKPPPTSSEREQEENQSKSKQKLTRTEIELALSKLPDNLLHQAEIIVLEHIRKKYWEEFSQSKSWDKLVQFLWSQDKQVCDKDFYPIRVLGRGGFGLGLFCDV